MGGGGPHPEGEEIENGIVHAGGFPVAGALAFSDFGLAVGGEDVDFVSAAELGGVEFPNDLFIWGEFENVGHAVLGVAVAANDHVAIVEEVSPAGIGEMVFDVFAGGDPDCFAVFVEDDRLVAIGEVDHDLVVLEEDGGEGPVILFASTEFREVGFDGADDFAIGFVFLDREGEKVGHEIVPAGKFPGHAGLHVGVVGFRLERALDSD